VELNPVRAGLVVPAQPWPWSSAIAHSGCEELDTFLAMEQRRKRWSKETSKEYIVAGNTEAEMAAIRQRTPAARWAEMSSSTRWSKRHVAVSRRRKAGVQAIRCRFRHKPDWYLKSDETTGTSRLHSFQNHQLLTLAKKKGDYRCAS
jgi:hypothetical protein